MGDPVSKITNWKISVESFQSLFASNWLANIRCAQKALLIRFLKFSKLINSPN